MFSSNSKGTVITKDAIPGDLRVDDDYITIEYEPVLDNINLPDNSTCDKEILSNQHNSSKLSKSPSPSCNGNFKTRKIDLQCKMQKCMSELAKEKEIQLKQCNSLIERNNWELQKYLKEHKLKCEMLQLENEKLQFELEKYNKEFQLRAREMQWKYELDCAHAKMKERIAVRKMNIKERVNLKELPKLHS